MATGLFLVFTLNFNLFANGFTIRYAGFFKTEFYAEFGFEFAANYVKMLFAKT